MFLIKPFLIAKFDCTLVRFLATAWHRWHKIFILPQRNINILKIEYQPGRKRWQKQFKFHYYQGWKNVKRRSILPTAKFRKFHIKMKKTKLNQLVNWQFNIPSTIYSNSIKLRKSRWCNHTKRLGNGNSTVWNEIISRYF